MTWYSDGTISITNGTSIVIGVGVNFIVANVQKGDALVIGGLRVEIALVVDETTLHLVNTWSGSTISAGTYHIEPIGKGHNSTGRLTETVLDHIKLLKLRIKNHVKKIENTPPTTPLVGDRYIVGLGTGVWLGHNNQYVVWTGIKWEFTNPDGLNGGMFCYVQDLQLIYIYVNNLWVSLIQTIANGTITLVKENASDVISIQYQYNNKILARHCLNANNDFSIETSTDGINFNSALVIDRNTGIVTLPLTEIVTKFMYNLFKDSGRFINTVGSNSVGVKAYAQPSYIIMYNGSSMQSHAQFLHGNLNASHADMQSLLLFMRNNATARSYGFCFWISELSIGAGTALSHTTDITRYGAFYIDVIPIKVGHTFNIYIKCSNKSLSIKASTSTAARYINGVLITDDVILTASDGWKQLTIINTQPDGASTGYEYIFPFYLEHLGKVLIALPSFFPGTITIDADKKIDLVPYVDISSNG